MPPPSVLDMFATWLGEFFFTIEGDTAVIGLLQSFLSFLPAKLGDALLPLLYYRLSAVTSAEEKYLFVARDCTLTVEEVRQRFVIDVYRETNDINKLEVTSTNGPACLSLSLSLSLSLAID